MGMDGLVNIKHRVQNSVLPGQFAEVGQFEVVFQRKTYRDVLKIDEDLYHCHLPAEDLNCHGYFKISVFWRQSDDVKFHVSGSPFACRILDCQKAGILSGNSTASASNEETGLDEVQTTWEERK